MKPQKNIPDLLFYTYVNKKYYPFGILYPLFVLLTNKKACVEIAVENINYFNKHYSKQMAWYEKSFSGRVLFHQVPHHRRCQPGAVRFITKPYLKAKYVYIGDSDIIILEDIIKQHIKNIKDNNLDYSNIKRKDDNKLSGLHFIEYNKMYPVKIPLFVNCRKISDEKLLYKLMQNKGYKVPDETKCTFRPIHGIHFSFFSRPPLPTLTTQDEIVTDKFPSSFDATEKKWIQKYLNVRYSNKILLEFMKTIEPQEIELRKIIQYIDVVCFYMLKRCE